MQKSRRIALGFAALFSGIVLFIVAIPLFFYGRLAVEYLETRQAEKMERYARRLERTILTFSAGEERTFYFPRSAVYDAAILDEKRQVIFSLLPETREFLPGVGIEEGRMRLVRPLGENVLGARWLVVESPFDYMPVAADLLLLIFVVSITVFAAAFWLMRRSLRPYEEANRYLEAFYKDAMHELKTPLGVLQLNLEMMEEARGETPPIRRCRAALAGLQTVYGDLEYLIRRERAAYPPVRLDLGRFAKERAALFSVLARTREVELSVQAQEGLTVRISEVELQRIVDNNLSNALKFVRKNGNVTVRVSSEGGRALLEVEDDGPGIRDTRAVFRRYWREEGPKGGFGIGLEIVRRICDRYGVEIDVISRLGEGARFRYLFPPSP